MIDESSHFSNMGSNNQSRLNRENLIIDEAGFDVDYP